MRRWNGTESVAFFTNLPFFLWLVIEPTSASPATLVVAIASVRASSAFYEGL